MLTNEMRKTLEDAGVTIIESRFAVCDEDGELTGVDDDGEPVERLSIDCNGKSVTPTTYVPPNSKAKWYAGDTKAEVKAKIRNKNPDFEARGKQGEMSK